MIRRVEEWRSREEIKGVRSREEIKGADSVCWGQRMIKKKLGMM